MPPHLNVMRRPRPATGTHRRVHPRPAPRRHHTDQVVIDLDEVDDDKTDDSDVQLLNGPLIHVTQDAGISQIPGSSQRRNKKLRSLDHREFDQTSTVFMGIRISLNDTIRSLQTGDMIRIDGISSLQEDGHHYIRGTAFCDTANENLANMVEKRPYEVCMVQDVFTDDKIHSGGFVLRDFSLEALYPLEKVKLVLTNAFLPRASQANEHFSDKSGRVQEVYYCRWKFMKVHKVASHHKRRGWESQMLCRLRYYECDQGFGITERTFRLGRNESTKRQAPAATRILNFYDAFCGAGFASHGARLAGMNVVGGFDWDLKAIKNYQENHPRAKALHKRQDEFLMSEAYKYRGRIAVLHISFPCQFFSPAHTITGKNDYENMIAILGLSEFLRIIKPRVVVIEETSGLGECIRHQSHLQDLLHDFTSANYDVQLAILHCDMYGIPQKRRRLVVIAAAPGERLPPFPSPTHNQLGKHHTSLLPAVTIHAALRSDRRRGHVNHNEQDPKLRLRRRGRPWDSRKLQMNTITCGGGGSPQNKYHYGGMREWTVHELMVLMGADHHYRLIGNRTTCKKQLGNGFPPIVAEKIYRECDKSLRETDQEDEDDDKRDDCHDQAPTDEADLRDAREQARLAMIRAQEEAARAQSTGIFDFEDEVIPSQAPQSLTNRGQSTTLESEQRKRKAEVIDEIDNDDESEWKDIGPELQYTNYHVTDDDESEWEDIGPELSYGNYHATDDNDEDLETALALSREQHEFEQTSRDLGEDVTIIDAEEFHSSAERSRARRTAVSLSFRSLSISREDEGTPSPTPGQRNPIDWHALLQPDQ